MEKCLNTDDMMTHSDIIEYIDNGINELRWEREYVDDIKFDVEVTIENMYNDIDGEIDALRGDINSLEDYQNGFQKDLDALRGDIIKLEASVRTLTLLYNIRHVNPIKRLWNRLLGRK